jgi:hypothetical protein
MQTPDLSLERKRKSASRWKTVAFYRHHTSANAKASGLRRSKRMSTLIEENNNDDLADVESDFGSDGNICVTKITKSTIR